MQSFYGGKPGFSFVIVKSFSSFDEMVKNFSQGGNYTEVHYDEYVLINTENKNDPNNGKIYRRGYDYTAVDDNNVATGGAIYVGTIVGPAGRAPMLELTTIEEAKTKGQAAGIDSRWSEGSYTLAEGDLVSGKYNDDIKYAVCSVRSANGEDTIAYIGFQIPYLVNEFIAESIEPYNSSGDYYIDNSQLASRVDDESKPFYEKWKFKIPKGIKGDAFKDFRVITASDDDGIEAYAGQADDRANSREILVYDYYHYDDNNSGEPVSIYLGDYNMISNIAFDEEGSITIEYSHDDTKEFNKLIKWIKEVTLDKHNGHFVVKYNHDTDADGNPTTYETDLSWVKDITIAEDGKVTLYWSTGGYDTLGINLRWIDNIEMFANGTVQVNYNDGTYDSFINMIKWVSNISLSQNGTFKVQYNNGSAPYQTTLKWVENIIIDEDGTVHIIYNNGDPVVYDKMIKYIDHIEFNETLNKFQVFYNDGTNEIVDEVIKFIEKVYVDETNDFLFHVVYNTGEDVAVSTQPVNYINETAIDETDYHLLVYYSNPNIRASLAASGQTRTYNGKDGWLDLGSVKDDAGVLIGLNILPSASPGIEVIDTAIIYLNGLYPNGLTDAKYYGKIVTIGEQGENKLFYAFDYDTNSWYYLGTFNNENYWTIVAKVDEANIDELKNKVAIGGVWFIVEGEDE